MFAVGPVVGLHVVIDRVAGPDPDRLRAGDGVGRGGGALRGRLRGRDRRAAARVGGRLQADVDRDDVPAGGGLRADPGGASGSAASRPCWRRRCRRRRRGTGTAASRSSWSATGSGRLSNPRPVKTPPGVLGIEATVAWARSAVRAGRAAGRRLAIAAGARWAVNWAPDDRSDAIDSAWRISLGSRPQVAVTTTWSRASTIRAADRPALGGGRGSRLARSAAGEPRSLRRDEDRLGAAERVGRAALVRRRGAEIDRVAVEAHARVRAGRQPEHGPARRDLDRVAAVADRPGPGDRRQRQGRHLRRGTSSTAVSSDRRRMSVAGKGGSQSDDSVAVCLRG